jgi:predicted nucleic acid-binding protein
VIILDTDALSHLHKNDPVGILILGRLDASPDRDIRITAITAYEMTGGATALIERRKKERRDLIPAFHLLQDLVEYLGTWRGLILPYEVTSEQIHASFPARLRQELKDDARIAAIALAHGATVWTCNVTDYTKVPGLIVVRAETGSRVP